MVEVAHRREVVALIIIVAQGYTVACSLCCSGVARILGIVVGNNVSGLQLVCFRAVSFAWKSPPSVGLVMVYHHVGNGSYVVCTEGFDERAQLFSRTEARILVKKVVGIVAH